MSDLLPAILKSVKAGQSEREIALGLKAIALMIITVPSDTIYDAVANPIKAAISDSQHPTVKVAAIHALSVATFYGGASTEETEDIMELLLEIVSSDGASVEEPDNADLVTAALEEWGFLATQLDDMEDATEPAMETFVDQLESSSSSVQIAAGENIALLFEKSHTEAESDDDSAGEEEEEETARRAAGAPRMIKRYTVYRQQHNLVRSLEELTRASSKRVSKKDRKAIHAAFQDVLNTVEKPTRGPRYSTALDEDGREYGSRLRVSIHGGGKMLIDSWWKLARLNGLKRLLQGGFLTHYERNEVVFESLPVIVEDDDGEYE
jgi:translation elongation factor EF-1beta